MYHNLYHSLINEDGQAIAEYALMLAIMVLMCVAGFTALGPSIRDRISSFAGDAYH